MTLRALPQPVIAQTPEEVCYGDIWLDQSGVVGERCSDHEHRGQYEWRHGLGNVRGYYAERVVESVTFPITILARQDYYA